MGATYKEWRLKNKPARAAYMREWRKGNQRWLQWSRAYAKNKYKTNPNFRIAMLLRSRLTIALRKTKKVKPTMTLIGCTPQFLRGYLEAQFTPGMTWDNIHIDHHIPCAAFDLNDPKQQEQCFHYSNLKPLLAADNLKKGARKC